MEPLLILHAVAAVFAPVLVRRFGRDAFLVLALPPGCGFAYTLWMALTGIPVESHHAFAPALGFELSFRADALAVLMMSLVTGVGALVLVYCSRYFAPADDGLGRFGGVLVAFAGAMLGLVVADNLLLLYVFWELTTVCSYLLIGHVPESRTGRRAAMEALTVLFGAGTRDTAIAGVGMLLAHALFKASLFLVVGLVDHATGTRDLRELSGLRRSAPWLCAVAVAAVASMAGIPPFLGFVGKEAAFESLLTGRFADTVTLAGVVAGSVLTVGYSARFLWGAFGSRPGLEPVAVHRSGAAMFLPPALLAVLGPLAAPFSSRYGQAMESYRRSAESRGLQDSVGRFPSVHVWYRCPAPNTQVKKIHDE